MARIAKSWKRKFQAGWRGTSKGKKMNLTFEWLAGILGSAAIAAFWKWTDKLSKADDEISKRLDALQQHIHAVELHYQSKDDAREQNHKITALLQEIKADLKELNQQIHQKADKP